MPKVVVHNPVLAYEVGAELMQAWYDAEEGKVVRHRLKAASISTMTTARVRSSDGLGLLILRFRGLELDENLPDHPVGVRLVVPESQKVRAQRLTGHLEFLVGEMDVVHAATLVLSAVSPGPWFGAIPASMRP